MKKIFVLALSVLCTLLCLLAVSCSDEDEADHQHIWDGGRIIKPSTKTEYGLIEYSCVLCSVKNNRVIAKQNHDHAFEEEWKSDRIAHWRACSVKDCLVLDKRDSHQWNDGEILVEANQQGAGKKKYTCTVCGYEKEESYAATSRVNSDEWRNAFDKSLFENVTVIYSQKQNGSESSITAEVSNTIIRYKEANGKVYTRENTAGVPFGSESIAKSIAFMQTNYDKATYDAGTRAYIFEIDGVKGSVQFSDKKITAFSVIKDGITERYAFSAYGRTDAEK